MAAQFLTLEIGSLIIPASAMGRLRVEYEDIAARTDRRTADGAFNRRTAWDGKLRATISGEGWAPHGLSALDLDSSHTVKLPVQRSIQEADASIDIPAARRSGGLYDPVAFAIVDGLLVPTTISVATNTATCGTVSGASGYQVDYYPQVTGYLSLPQQSLDGDRASHGWQLLVEQA